MTTISNTKPHEAVWKQIARNNQNDVVSTLLYILIKAANAKNPNKTEVVEGLLLKTFTPITNLNKLFNGQGPWGNESIGVKGATNRLSAKLKTFRRGVFDAKSNAARLWETQTVAQQNDIEDLLEALKTNLNKIEDKVTAYFFVRTDISPIAQAVQLAHAAQILGKYETKSDPYAQTFVVYRAVNEDHLWNIAIELGIAGFETRIFQEPDLDDEATAMVMFPVRASVAKRHEIIQNATLLTL